MKAVNKKIMLNRSHVLIFIQFYVLQLVFKAVSENFAIFIT